MKSPIRLNGMLIQSKIKKELPLSVSIRMPLHKTRQTGPPLPKQLAMAHLAIRTPNTKDASSGGATGIEPPVWIEESGSYTVSYLLDRPGYSCRAFVFNTSGLRVADISNHELLGISGKITWSGVANNGSPLQTGVYIFYAEIYHPEGTVKRFKKAFLIR